MASSGLKSPPLSAKASRSKKFRIGLVGVGHRGYRTHFTGLLGSRSEHVVAVCDTNEQARTTFAAAHPDIPTFDSVQEMINSHEFDFIIISIPHKFHFDCISTIAAAGIPVLKEKPVAESYEEFVQLSELPVDIGVTFQKRFEPRYIQLQKLLPQIGKIASFRATLAVGIEDLESSWRASDGVGVTVCVVSSFVFDFVTIGSSIVFC